MVAFHDGYRARQPHGLGSTTDALAVLHSPHMTVVVVVGVRCAPVEHLVGRVRVDVRPRNRLANDHSVNTDGKLHASLVLRRRRRGHQRRASTLKRRVLRHPNDPEYVFPGRNVYLHRRDGLPRDAVVNLRAVEEPPVGGCTAHRSTKAGVLRPCAQPLVGVRTLVVGPGAVRHVHLGDGERPAADVLLVDATVDLLSDGLVRLVEPRRVDNLRTLERPGRKDGRHAQPRLMRAPRSAATTPSNANAAMLMYSDALGTPTNSKAKLSTLRSCMSNRFQ